jgi:hypothetical protein
MFKSLRGGALTIAVVGNGPVSPGDNGIKYDIDAHDLVVRFNSCANYRRTGKKTDFLVLINTPNGRRFGRQQGAIDKCALESAKEFWFPYSPTLIASIADQNPSRWQDVSDDLISRLVKNRPWRYIDAEIYWAAMNTLKMMGASPDKTPSTGLLCLFYLEKHFNPCKVTLYGFTHEGWSGHAWNAEREIIDNLGEMVIKAAATSATRRFLNRTKIKLQSLKTRTLPRILFSNQLDRIQNDSLHTETEVNELGEQITWLTDP